MKKLLSAVLMMMTIVAAATLTGSVLAAEPYEYIPEDGSAVVYVSNSGEVNKALGVQEFTDIGTAVSTVGKTGGYVILLEKFKRYIIILFISGIDKRHTFCGKNNSVECTECFASESVS